IAGTEGAKPWDLDLSGVLAGTEGLFAASPWERGRPGRTPAGRKGRPVKPRTAPVRKSQSGRAGRASGEEIAGFIQDWVEEEAALAELGFTPDGLPDPAVWGEEAITDPEGLLAQIAAGRKPPQSGPLAPRADAADRSHSERTTLPDEPPAGQKGRSAETAEAAAGGSQSGRDGRAPREEDGRAPGAAIAGFIQDWVEEEAALAELGFTPDGLPDPAVWGEEALTDPEGLLAQIAAGRKP